MMLDACERLSANISKLMLIGDITETEKTFHELLTNKVTIKFNVFRALMKDWIFGNIYGCQIVTIDWNWSNRSKSKLREKPIEPRKFCSETFVFYFSRGQGDSYLLLGFPADQGIAKKDNKTTDRFTIMRTRGPISFTISQKVKCGALAEQKTQCRLIFKVLST